MAPSSKGKLTHEDLTALAEAGGIETVVAASVDIHGRLKGARLPVRFFLDKAHRGFPSGDVFPVPVLDRRDTDGLQGGEIPARPAEVTMRPDLATLRRAAWLPDTALVLCDALDTGGRSRVPHCPRGMLKQQIARAKEAGFDVLASTDLEFTVFGVGIDDLRSNGFRQLDGQPATPFDGAMGLSANDIRVAERLQGELVESGVPVEASREGAVQGMHAVGLAAAPALAAADNHAIAKHAAKTIGADERRAVSFLPQLHKNRPGCGTSVCLSLWQGREPSFYDETLTLGVSRLMRSFVAGMIRGIDECMLFLAPRINSYKRLHVDRLAPTRKVWTLTSRSAAFRLCGSGKRSIRIECRVPGADANPHLVMATLLAAGLDGVRQHLDCGDPVEDDAFDAGIAHVPLDLKDSILALRSSSTMRKAFGDPVIDHYIRAAEWEQGAFDRAVTDWELLTGFETA